MNKTLFLSLSLFQNAFIAHVTNSNNENGMCNSLFSVIFVIMCHFLLICRLSLYMRIKSVVARQQPSFSFRHLLSSNLFTFHLLSHFVWWSFFYAVAAKKAAFWHNVDFLMLICVCVCVSFNWTNSVCWLQFLTPNFICLNTFSHFIWTTFC